jgi:hypothetical protein
MVASRMTMKKPRHATVRASARVDRVVVMPRGSACASPRTSGTRAGFRPMNP